MKRKIFSKLLMGAFLIASISSFVSCKDYDDDIKVINDKLATVALQTTVDNLQSQLQSAAAAAAAAQKTADQAVAAAAAAQATANDAATKAALATVEATAKAAGEEAAKAITNAAAAQTAAEAAQKTADQAAEAAKAAQEAADKAAAAAAAGTDAAKADAAAAAAAAAAAQKVAEEAAAAAAKAASDNKSATDAAAEVAKAAKAAADDVTAKIATLSTQIAAAQSTAEAAQKAAEAAQKAAELAAGKEVDLSNYVTKADLTAALKDYAKAVNDYVTNDKLNEALTPIKEQLEKVNKDLEKIEVLGDLAAFKQKVDNYEAGINATFTAITSISLYTTLVNNGNNTANTQTVDKLNGLTGITNLQFVKGNVNRANAHYTRFNNAAATMATTGDGRFSNASYKDYVNGVAYYSATEALSFSNGAAVKYPTSIYVRVSPSNATLTKEGIKLIDGNGNALTAIEIVDVNPYTALLTRAGSTSGLWKIDLNISNNKGTADVQKATLVKADGSGYAGNTDITAANIGGTKQALFAVAATNTANVDVETAADRYAVSEYGITINKTPIIDYVGPWSLVGVKDRNVTTDPLPSAVNVDVNGYVLVNNTSLGLVKNRITTAAATDKGNFDELSWRNDGFNATAPATTSSTIADDRNTKGYIIINNGGKVKVDLRNLKLNGIAPKAYYVVRDDYNANATNAESELNAWKSYVYTGNLNTLLDPKSDVCEFTITIPEPLLTGDAVAFRIMAVNEDGTLVDPDGAGFEVWVGPNSGSNTVTDNFTPTANNGEWFYFAFTPSVKTGDFPTQGANVTMKINSTTVNTMQYYLMTAKRTGAPTTTSNAPYQATKWDDIKYIAVKTSNVRAWTDGAEASGTIKVNKTTNGVPQQVNAINLKLTKVMPTSIPSAYMWKAGQPGDPFNTSNYICYAYPKAATTNTADWTQTWAAQGFKNFNEALNGLDDINYIFVIENMDLDANGNRVVSHAYTATAANQYFVTVDRELVTMAGTSHAGKVYYRYNNISSSGDNVDPSDITGNTKTPHYYVEGPAYTVTFTCPLESSMQTYDWTYVPAADAVVSPVTGITITPATPAIYYNTINYTETGNVIVTPNNVPVGKNITDYIKGSNTWNNTTFGKPLFNLLPANVVDPAVGYARFDGATLTSDETGNEDYFTVRLNTAADPFVNPAGGAAITYPANTRLVFVSKSGTTNPATDVPSTLTLKFKDAFNHTTTIKLPMIVKHI